MERFHMRIWLSLLAKKGSSICLSLACRRLLKQTLINFCKQLHLQLTSKYIYTLLIFLFISITKYQNFVFSIHVILTLQIKVPYIELKCRLLGKAKLQSVQLYLFGPKNSHTLVKELKAERHSVGGCGGLIGRKKGAVAIRINYDDIKMVFISCHLSAHAKKVDQRNTELKHIANSLLPREKRKRDLTVWLGDLNYRIQDASNRPVRSLIQNHLQSVLVSKDQLLQEAERGEIFKGYSEGTLGFKPTYKYNVGSSDYDTSHKIRVPAWTDRILFKIQNTDNIQATLHSYDSIDQVYGSDHKPVKADLCLKWVNN
ncbi:Inositol polyphosphate-related phosphatase [Arabidopsis thaliana x Arabidopsis arenosa]|uniref:Inositol polyphosphate-related phosphatase n=1 Tax=Arabidopsis thaliana x Arabidopsis arenosa TaxID=1240361 RepID=A0A8T2CGN7_9BRAS|nr:Inositol polyphosphate-related phosphatase [Arabidopsis thaliana x Arabidopsis arenosa]